MQNHRIFLSLVAAIGAVSIGPVAASPSHCPPGLAKKAVPCVPPGQARKWRVGDRLPADAAWYEVTDWARYDLPAPPDGNRYVMIDSDILLIAIATGLVLDYLGTF